MSSNDTPLAGKVAIVTGSGRGLGLAYAAELARQGASVVVNDVDAQTAADAVATIEAQGGKAVAVVAPVGSTETAKALVAAAVDNFGRLDILVTNAGVLRDTVLWKMSDDDFDTVINVHLRGTFTCVREAATYMRENEIAGRIICIGSPTGQRGNFGQTNYAAAKAGIVGMVRTWALELKRAGITANAVIPVAATAMTATVPYFAAAVEADAAGEPMPAFFRHDLGFGTSDDVAGLIAYLASDAAAGVTGQAIGVGGDRIQVWSHPEPVAVRLPRRRLDVRRARRRLRRRVRRTAPVGGREVPAAAGRPPAARRPPPDPSTGSGTEDDPLRTRDRPRRPRGDRRARAHRDRRARALVAAGRPRRGGEPLLHADGPRPDLDSIAAYYRERKMAAVVFTVDAETNLGQAPISSAEIAEGAARNNDVLIPFGSVDPHREDAVERVRRLIDDSGVRGFKFHPTVQGFDPSDEAHYPLYAAIQDAGIPAIFHTGQTGIGAGTAAVAAACGSDCRTRCCSTRSRRTSPTCRSSWPTPRCRGRTRRSRSRRTSTTPGSTCPAGAPSTSRPSWCATPTRS